MTAEEYIQLQKRVATAKAQALQSKGAYKGAIERLKKDFDVSSVAEARKHLKQMGIDLVKLEKAFDTALSTFNKKWEEYLER